MHREDTLWYMLDCRAASLFFHAFHMPCTQEADWYAVWRCHLSRAQEEYLIGLIEALPYSYIYMVEGHKYTDIQTSYERYMLQETINISFGYLWQHTAVLLYIDGTTRGILAKGKTIAGLFGTNTTGSAKGARRRGRKGSGLS